MKRMILLAAVFALALAAPALAQNGGETCAIPEGCDAPAPTDPSYETPPDPTEAATSPPAAEAESGAGVGSKGSSPPAKASSPSQGGAGSGPATGSAGASVPSTGEGPPAEGLAALPETGGAPATMVGVGALLVVGGLLARRIFR